MLIRRVIVPLQSTVSHGFAFVIRMVCVVVMTMVAVVALLVMRVRVMRMLFRRMLFVGVRVMRMPLPTPAFPQSAAGEALREDCQKSALAIFSGG